MHPEFCEELNWLVYHTHNGKRWQRPQQFIKLLRSFGGN